MAPELVFKDKEREARLVRQRIVISAVIVVCLIAVLVLRLFYLQVVRHAHYTTLSQENRVKILPLAPTRGLIYSRDGVLLAENQPNFSLEIIPEQVPDLDALIRQLQQVVRLENIDIERFHQSLRRYRRFDRVPLRFGLNEEEVAALAVRRHEFPGVEVAARLKRYYPLGAETAHVVGYVGRIDEADQGRIDLANYRATSHIGKLGIEKAYEDLLHGRAGYEQVEVNAEGRILRVLDRTAPRPGQNLRLTLDVSLQRAAMRALGDRRGSVVAIDPNNGEVLALVSSPSFDPNLFVDGIRAEVYRELRDSPDRPLFNRALQGQYPPGSTIKPFLGMVALESGVRAPAERIWCPGWFSLPGSDHLFRDWQKQGHGWMDLTSAIIQSCDVYFYSLANDLGIGRIHDYLVRFGFGARTGIDTTSESAGVVPSKEWKKQVYGQPWFPGETVITGIGQGSLLATPLQLAAATATLASRGRFVQPHLLLESSDPSNDLVTFRFKPRTRNLGMSNPEHWQAIHQAMIDVVHGAAGTARRIGTGISYRIAGKTGTAQIIGVPQDKTYDPDSIPERYRDHALFIAFAPADAPRIALAILVENGGSGSASAAPIARQLFDHHLKRVPRLGQG